MQALLDEVSESWRKEPAPISYQEDQTVRLYPLLLQHELWEDSNEKLFSHLYKYNPNHVLRRLLPQLRNTRHKLCQRTRNLILSTDVSAVDKRNFVHRMLFRAIDCVYCFMVILSSCIFFTRTYFRAIVYFSRQLYVIFHCVLHLCLSYVSWSIFTYLLT